jgi:hypothetical protein
VRGFRVDYVIEISYSQAFNTTYGTDVSGRFALQSIPSDAEILHVFHPDYADAWLPLPGAQERDELLVILSPGGSLEIRLSLVWASSPITSVRLTRAGLPFPLVLFPSNCSFPTPVGDLLIPHLEEGTWTVEALHGSVSRRDVVTVREGKRAVADLSEPGTP